MRIGAWELPLSATEFDRTILRRAGEACFTALAENPLLGRSAEELAPNLGRFAHGSHVVFYEPREGGVLIVRVLHESMDATSHL